MKIILIRTGHDFTYNLFFKFIKNLQFEANDNGDKYVGNRGMVHALSPGNPHQLGLEDGVGCLRWKAPQSEAASSTSRSSQVFILTHSCIHTDHKLP